MDKEKSDGKRADSPERKVLQTSKD